MQEMAYRQEELVAEIIEEAALLPRPRQIHAPDPDQPRSPRWRASIPWLENQNPQ